MTVYVVCCMEDIGVNVHGVYADHATAVRVRDRLNDADSDHVDEYQWVVSAHQVRRARRSS